MVMLCTKLDKVELPIFLSLSEAKGNWIAEIKEDGDRVRLRAKDNAVKMTNRRGKDVTFVYPDLHNVKGDFLIDGEMCVMANGISEFNDGITHRSHCKDPQKILNAIKDYPVTYVVFDILELDGKNLRDYPLKVRKKILASLKLDEQYPNIQISVVRTDVMNAWKEICALGGEGLVLKDMNTTYQEDKRSKSWIKVKDIKEVDLTFNQYELHPNGITLENTDGIRVVCNGAQSTPVAKAIDDNGDVCVTIRHLGQTPAGKYRQPTFMKLVGELN